MSSPALLTACRIVPPEVATATLDPPFWPGGHGVGDSEVASAHFGASLEHLLAELERIDLLIARQVARARGLARTSDGLQGLYLAEEEVDRLLARPVGLPPWALEEEDATASVGVRATLARLSADIARRGTESRRRGIVLRLDRLVRWFQLDDFEKDILLIGLAPELDLRFERLFAYLQDDVTRKRPSVDLALNLLCPSLTAKVAARRYFAADAPLLSQQLLTASADPAQPHPPLLGRALQLDERIAAYLLGLDALDANLARFVQRLVPRVAWDAALVADEARQRLQALARAHGQAGLVCYFQGSYGAGRQAAAESLCAELEIGLLRVESERLLGLDRDALATIARRLTREALLQNAGLYWADFDALLADDRRGELDVLLRELEIRPGLSFLAGSAAWEPLGALRDRPFARFAFPRPSHGQRAQCWTQSLKNVVSADAGLDCAALADSFRFTPGQIRDAVASARNLARWRDPERCAVAQDDLQQACRLQSNRKLTALAQRINPRHRWDDLVLPADRLAQLRELCNQIKYRGRVYDDWGFDAKLSLGKGLNALFTGPSGTGKTMAAEVIAGALGLDLYKIDLSSLVSKYIGETEKHLARLFAEAETSHGILFFDEADALFGKRTEVRDAHDRYANLETNYLLQRLEAFDGVVILATNFRKNMDDAFVRRLHFAVEFPFPGARDRQRIWRRIWPEATPRAPDLDLDFLASRFEIAGGNIRNIALAAAFLAADQGGMVTMAHCLHAVRREFQKMGKVMSESEFGDCARPATQDLSVR